MRLWHKSLVSALPKQQLTGQWRECCLIAKNIAENGTPNHILVNEIVDYPIEHLFKYAAIVHGAMQYRGYSCVWKKFIQHFEKSGYDCDAITDKMHSMSFKEVFLNWHNDRYLAQCLYNLQEKYDCGGITSKEWNVIQKYVLETSFPNAVPDNILEAIK